MIDVDVDDPVKTIVELTDDIGVDRAIDAVGVDAEHAHHGPAAKQARKQKAQFDKEQKQVAPHPMGNTPHRKYIPELLRLIRSGAVDVAPLLTRHEPMTSAIEAYKAFDQRSPGWIKVKLEPDGAAMANGRETAATDQRPTP